jgi:hypothetical protein
MDELEECSRVPPNGVVQREPHEWNKEKRQEKRDGCVANDSYEALKTRSPG